ncbi:MAG: glycosyltransferase family 9 protein [Bacteroidota bacterium]|nr:glycosyltransferase family 9 protein [Bacteroidota bacterium]
MQKILVIQTAFIGDAILASAVLEKLHQCFPFVQLDLLVRKGNETLYKDHPFLSNCIVWNKQEGKYKSLFALRKKIKAEQYDKVINLHRFASSGFLTAFSGAKEKIGFDKNPFSFMFSKKIKHEIGSGKHEVERNQQLIESFTDNQFAKPKLYPTLSNFEKVKEYKTGEYVCMAPSSVWFTKQLPFHKWVELCDKLSPTTTIYLLGAPGDAKLCDEINANSTHQRIINLSGKLNLLDSCALMKDAKMNYVNDSAPLHLASAMNAPTTAFFCSTVPSFGFTPLADNSRVVETSKQLDCKPCGLHGYKQCPKGHFDCGNTIEV